MMHRSLMLALLLMSANAVAQIHVTPTDGITITVHSQVTPIPLNQMHSWVITLHTPAGDPVENANIQVEGGMPLHDHGLATRPQVTDYLGDGQYLIEGLRFHMPGEWLLEIQIDHQGQRYRSEAMFRFGAGVYQPFLNATPD